MKKMLALCLSAALCLSLTGPAGAGKKRKKKKSKKRPPIEVVMFEDVAGDADMATGAGDSIPGGFDLLEGRIRKAKKDLEFEVKHADMPPIGSLPEGFRFLWAFNVNGDNFRLTVKTADIGKPDLLAGQTTDRVGRVDLQGHFRLEGECKSTTTGVLNAIDCPVIEYVDGVFDPAAMSFKVTVPMKLVGAKKNSTVGPGGGNNIGICSICWVSHTEERSLDSTIVDDAFSAVVYRVP